MTLQEIINIGRRIVFFGGAGVSTESGIPDFRSEDGLYRQKYAYPPEEILSADFFKREPEEFYRFYRDKMLPLWAEPNAAHRKLAELERAGKLTAVVTQNIDGLHQKAGSRNVFELHGTIHKNTCLKCGKKYDAKYIADSSGVPRCSCGGMIKPDVVLYGEMLDDATVAGALKAISEADISTATISCSSIARRRSSIPSASLSSEKMSGRSFPNSKYEIPYRDIRMPDESA